MIEKALVTLLTDATISLYVSDRVYALEIPQGEAVPAIVYHRIYTDRIRALSDDTDMVMARFQITIHGDEFLKNKTITNAVRAKLQRYTGTVNSTIIDDIKIENEIDLSENENFQSILDIYVTYRE